MSDHFRWEDDRDYVTRQSRRKAGRPMGPGAPHYPNKRPIPGSPSDHRALANFKAQLRQFVGPPPGETK